MTRVVFYLLVGMFLGASAAAVGGPRFDPVLGLLTQIHNDLDQYNARLAFQDGALARLMEQCRP